MIACTLLACGCFTAAWAATKYVSPTGGASAPIDGSDWDHAYSNLQDAVNVCLAEASVIYLQSGAYSNTAAIGIANAVDLTIRGGYAGDTVGGLPGSTSGVPSLVTRNTNYSVRIFDCTNSVLTLACLTVTNGYGAGNGGGMQLLNCSVTLTNCAIRRNQNSASGYGGGLHVVGGSLAVLGGEISANIAYAASTTYGGGMYASGAALTMRDTVVATNYTTAGGGMAQGYGGGLYLAGGSASIAGCSFFTNCDYGGHASLGGAIFAAGAISLQISNCTFVGNTVAYGDSTRNGGVLYLTGAATSLVADCAFWKNDMPAGSAEDIFLDSTGPTEIRNSVISRCNNRGIYKQNSGSLLVTNCLVEWSQTSHGIQVRTGAVTIANTTLANNFGWGIYNATGAVVITDAIIWGNYAGGVTGPAVTASYTDCQEPLAGSGNISADPRFIAGAFLATNALPFQPSSSPCIDAGSATAEALGLTNRTTRTDGGGDLGQVDLGYHAVAGLPGGAISNLLLYVDIMNGSNTNTGWSPDNALSNITFALTRALDGSTINIAAGNYTTNAGEVFPLAPAYADLVLRGTNRDATVINGGGNAGILATVAAGHLALETLTFTNGRSGTGSGLSLVNCQASVSNCAFHGNPCTAYGGAIYAAGGTLGVYGSDISGNINAAANLSYGGGIYASGVGLTVKSTSFVSNNVYAGGGSAQGYGAGLYLNGGAALVADCAFIGNYSSGGWSSLGGAIHAAGSGSLVLSNCTFNGNYGTSSGSTPLGGVLYITGGRTNLIADCTLLRNNISGAATEDVFLDCSGPTIFRNTVVGGGYYRGLFKQNSGPLALTNCLIHSFQTGNGLHVLTGAVTIASSTLANNYGWGLFSATGAITIVDSIVWGNAAGGMTGGTINATFTDCQEPFPGTGNLNADPRFIFGYYLSTNGLPAQTFNSPAIDAGYATADALGLTNRTTRTDGAGDHDQVDLGYHYTNGVSDTTLSNLVLYVDIVNGNNANDGWNPASALSNITYALTRAVDGGRLNIAAGTYNTNKGEVFPLAPLNMNMTLRGTNREATVIDAGASGVGLSASGVGTLWLEGFTITNGKSANGGGLYLLNCQTTVTNCALRGNAGYVYGGGIYAKGASLGVYHCEITKNLYPAASSSYGGGIYANSLALVVKSSTIASNAVYGVGSMCQGYGGGIYLTGGSAMVDGCTFLANTCNGVNDSLGGAIYAAGSGSLTLTNCTLTGNYVTNGPGKSRAGGVLYFAGAASARIINCSLLGNTNSVSAEDLYVSTSGQITLWNTMLGLGSAAGVRQAGGRVALTNCLIYAEPGHGIQVTGGTNSVGNTTIAANGGWGITNGAGSVAMMNSIVWSNAAGGVTNVAADYSDLQNAVTGAHNLCAEPRFGGAATNNFRLLKGSPCINGGSNADWMAFAQDLDGNARLRSTQVDMGAYEAEDAGGGTLIFFQ